MIKVTIRKNVVNPPQGRRLEVYPEFDTFTSFLNKCSAELAIRAKRIYDSQGAQISMLPELIPNEIYYISEVYFSL